jgi:hypothetical protein
MLEETEGSTAGGLMLRSVLSFTRIGDSLKTKAEAEEKYREAHYYWAIFASWATSGGEGTARMRDAIGCWKSWRI